MAEDPRRFVADASEDLAIGLGPDTAMRFVGMSLLETLRDEGRTDDQIYELLPADGHAAMVREQLSSTEPAKLSAVWKDALRAIDGK